MIPKLDHLYFVKINNKPLSLKTFTRYTSKVQMLRAVVSKVFVISEPAASVSPRD